MSKLHEILAVEGDLEKTSKKLIEETKKTFQKDNLFSGTVRTLTMSDADQSEWNTVDKQKLETTVMELFAYTNSEVAKYWDAVLQKDTTNQAATADIVLDDGTILAEQVPVTFLLGLETKLKDFRNLLNAIPTLPPGIRWEQDLNERKGVYIAEDDTVQFKTKNDIEIRVAYEATKEHPAQLEKINVVKNVGKYVTVKHSGMMPPYLKARMVAKHESLLRAVKKARQRANNQEITKKDIGDNIFNYIMN